MLNNSHLITVETVASVSVGSFAVNENRKQRRRALGRQVPSVRGLMKGENSAEVLGSKC
jgi:hypothetical protein